MECSDRLRIYEIACRHLDNEGWDVTLHPGYSGRGMYGRTTPALSTDAPSALVGAAIYAAAVEHLGRHYFEEISGVVPDRTDSMATQTIYY